MLYGLSNYNFLYKVDPVAQSVAIVSSEGGANPNFFLGSDGQFYGSGTSYDTGANIIFRFQPDGSNLTVYDPASIADTPLFYSTAMLEAADGTVAGNATTTDQTAYPQSYSFFDVPVTTGLHGAIQLSFSSPTARVNQPVVLTWTVSNAFSPTAQQCHATVQGSAAGAGGWSGEQTGQMEGSAYTGWATILPTAAGTYTYALTCGETQSGFATLVVQ